MEALKLLGLFVIVMAAGLAGLAVGLSEPGFTAMWFVKITIVGLASGITAGLYTWFFL
jgi:hypothetical protein